STHPTPLLFVHGAWHGSWCWKEHFLPYFAQHGYASYTFDLRGHGTSEGGKRLRWTRIANYVTDVEQITRQFDRPPVLIGHSMGGLVVQKYLETHHAPAAVLLASVPPTGALRTTLSIMRRHPLPFLKANATLKLYPIVGTPALTREAFFPAGMSEEEVQRYFTLIQDESYRAFLDMMVFSLPRPKRVKTPMLVLGAECDTIFSPKEVRATARAYHMEATIFPSMAHDMMLGNGWQNVADHMLRWLNERGI
ncbi:MAG TPA: alpha/beta fold hydrolase, partial [Ktedonobacteraceae bacterium]